MHNIQSNQALLTHEERRYTEPEKQCNIEPQNIFFLNGKLFKFLLPFNGNGYVTNWHMKIYKYIRTLIKKHN